MIYPKNSKIKVAKSFKASEFDCPCSLSSCTTTVVDEKLIELLQKLRDHTGPLTITSGYRCQAYQDDLAKRGYETAKNSQHLLGKAADVLNPKFGGLMMEDFARLVGFEAVGVAMNWIHVDTRTGAKRRWEYKR